MPLGLPWSSWGSLGEQGRWQAPPVEKKSGQPCAQGHRRGPAPPPPAVLLSRGCPLGEAEVGALPGRTPPRRPGPKPFLTPAQPTLCQAMPVPAVKEAPAGGSRLWVAQTGHAGLTTGGALGKGHARGEPASPQSLCETARREGHGGTPEPTDPDVLGEPQGRCADTW